VEKVVFLFPTFFFQRNSLSLFCPVYYSHSPPIRSTLERKSCFTILLCLVLFSCFIFDSILSGCKSSESGKACPEMKWDFLYPPSIHFREEGSLFSWSRCWSGWKAFNPLEFESLIVSFIILTSPVGASWRNRENSGPHSPIVNLNYKLSLSCSGVFLSNVCTKLQKTREYKGVF